jgi:hypothetical protein
MKKVLKRVFINKFSEILMILFVTGFSLDLLAFPMMSAASTVKNIIGGAILIFFVMFIVVYVNDIITDGKDELKNEDEGETELDYIPKPKKKSNPKQFDGVKSDEPFVKTRKKPKTKK